MDLTKREHFDRLEETSLAVWPLLESGVAARINALAIPEAATDLELLLARRRSAHLLRPYVARICLETTNASDWDSAPNLALLAATEALNLSTYYANFAFDTKGDVGLRNSTAANQFICSMLLLAHAESLVSEALGETPDACVRGLAQLRDRNQDVYAGQYLDLNVLTHGNLARLRRQGVAAFEEVYARRCHLLCGSTFRLATIMLENTETADDHVVAITSILESLGCGIQAVNDLADLIPSPQRSYADAAADLRNGRLTLPLYRLAAAGTDVELLRSQLTEHLRDEASTERLLNDIRAIAPVHEVRAFVWDRCWLPIRRALRYLRRRHPSQALRYFDFIPHLFFESRIMRHFEEPRESPLQ